AALLAAPPSPGAAPPARPRLDRHGDRLPQYALARLGTVRFYDPEGVWSMAFSRDGKTLLTSNGNGVRSWRFPDGTRAGFRSQKRNEDVGHPLFLFRAGDAMHVASWEGKQVVVRDAASGELVRKLPESDDRLFPEAVSPDGRL